MVRALKKPRETPEPHALPGGLEVRLRVTDPEMVEELSARPEGRRREEFARTALRIGILALKQAQGRLDADSLRSEGRRLIEELDGRLRGHRDAVAAHLSASLKEYFDPQSGRFQERVERLVKRDGELEQVLRRQIGTEDSELAKTLTAHFGEKSPLMKVLSPDESEGVLGSLRRTLSEELSAQRDGILKEFSLDRKESALSRLVSELQGNMQEVVGEFSLDREDSALSRLVKRVESAEKKISSQFSLDTETSALARMKRELMGVLAEQKEASTRFQQEVRETLAAMAARKEEARRSTAHGSEFEAEVHHFLQGACQKAGDIAEHTGMTTGLIKNCKVGDVVIELGPEFAAAGARIAVEAKEDASSTLVKAREEICVARKNRGAEVGMFVFSALTAPAGLEAFSRIGSDVFVVWNAEDEGSDVYLLAGLSLARALCTRTAAERQSRQADFESIDRAIRSVEKQAGGLDQITTQTDGIVVSCEKILSRARIMKKELRREIDTLDERVEELKDLLPDEGD